MTKIAGKFDDVEAWNGIPGIAINAAQAQRLIELQAVYKLQDGRTWLEFASDLHREAASEATARAQPIVPGFEDDEGPIDDTEIDFENFLFGTRW